MKSPSERLIAINKELSTLEARRQKLLIAKAELEQPTARLVSNKNGLSKNDRISIFKDLFKGRTDCFASRWENPNKGTSGYSIACHNEWKDGICYKRPRGRVKCSECQNKKFIKLNEQVILEHLIGKRVIGVYPLLKNNHCFFLAADFDKEGWRNEVNAMSQACKLLEVPHAVEISRSGNGAHLWVFFSEAIEAQFARKLGFALLDKAMEIYPELPFNAYDRLFPNQDSMPEGGFGNLIALPLQYQARENGNTLFVDSSFIPFEDQWQFLNGLEKISAAEVLDILPSSNDDMNASNNTEPAPWEQGQALTKTHIENCPANISVVLANHVYIPINELPTALITRLKRLASFSNSRFFKTQAMRFSTHGIPRYITCARLEQGYLILPRGCADDAMELLREQNIRIDIEEKRNSGEQLTDLIFQGVLKKEQLKACDQLFQHDNGILHAPTAFGKTITAIGLITKRQTNTLILTHSKQLVDQWKERLKTFTMGANIGVITGSKKNPTRQIDIATYQSLINKKDNTIKPIVQEYGHVIVDECHRISAPNFQMVLDEVRAKFVLGLTATPERQDGHQKIIFMVAGPIRHKVKDSKTKDFRQKVITHHLHDQPPLDLANNDKRPHISDIYRWLTDNDSRTEHIINDIKEAIKNQKHPLVLTERRDHAEIIHQKLSDQGVNNIIMSGGMKAAQRKAVTDQIDSTDVIVATGKFIGEGFDMPKLDALFLALPIAWKGTLSQYAGRIHRTTEEKREVVIYDYIDNGLPTLKRMYRKREKGYLTMGYEILGNQINY